MDDHNNTNQQPSYPFNNGYHYSQTNHFIPTMHYNFPPPPFHEMNIPPPSLPLGCEFQQPPPYTLAPHALQLSYPPMPDPFTPSYSQVSQYSTGQYVTLQQHVPAWNPVQSNATQPLVSRLQGPYSGHKPVSKRPLSSRASEKPAMSRSISLATGRSEQRKASQNSTYEEEHITEPDQYSSITPEEIMENERKIWTRCAPADLYYTRDVANPRLMRGTDKLKITINQFSNDLLKRGDEARTMQPKFDYPSRKTRKHGAHCGGPCKEKAKKACESDSSTSDSSSEEEDEVDLVLQELERKKQHPARLHPELWYNDPGEMNDGPLCRCR